MRKGALEYCVMALMSDDERYGFELVQTLRDFDGVVTTEGTVYPLLSRLRKDGRVETLGASWLLDHHAATITSLTKDVNRWNASLSSGSGFATEWMLC